MLLRANSGQNVQSYSSGPSRSPRNSERLQQRFRRVTITLSVNLPPGTQSTIDDEAKSSCLRKRPIGNAWSIGSRRSLILEYLAISTISGSAECKVGSYSQVSHDIKNCVSIQTTKLHIWTRHISGRCPKLSALFFLDKSITEDSVG